jgi:hypothetical protein
MTRLALVDGDTVRNVIVGEPGEWPNGLVLGNGLEASPGDRWTGSRFVTPDSGPVVKTWDELQLMREFTLAERVAIIAAASTDPLIASLLTMARATVVNGGRVRADDPDLIAGLGYLVAAGLLADVRPSEIRGS